MAKFNINCPHCGGELEAQTEWTGEEVACPYCQKDFIVPRRKLKLKKTESTGDAEEESPRPNCQKYPIKQKQGRSTEMAKFNRTQEPDSDQEMEDNGKGGCGAGTIAIGLNLIGIIMMWLDLEGWWIFMAIGGIIFMLALLPDFIKNGW